MSISRSINIAHNNALDLSYRVGMHVDPKGNTTPVVEVWYRNEHGEYQRISAYHLDDYIDVSREVVRVAKGISEPEAGE